MTAREAAFRESFYRCLSTDLARIRMLQSRHAGVLALRLNGEPLTWALGDRESQRRYLEVLEEVDASIQADYLGLNVWS